MFQLLFTIALKFGIYLYNVKKYSQQYIKNINKNIFNNFLIAESRRTRIRTLLFQKLPSPAPAPAPAPAPESRNAPVLHRLGLPFVLIIANDERPQSRQFHPKYLWLLTLIKQNYGNLINYVNASRTSVGSSKSGSDLLSGEKQCSTMFLDTCSNLGGFHCI